MNRAKQKLNLNQSLDSCLRYVSTEEVLDSQLAQKLGNLIQGKFLEHLVDYIVDYNQITDKKLIAKLTSALMQIMSKRFCVAFREKVQEEPSILIEIAKKIAYNESKQKEQSRVDCLYLWICKKYFGFKDISLFVRRIQTEPSIQSIIFLSLVKKSSLSENIKEKVIDLAKDDDEGIFPIMCNRYFHKNKLERFSQIFKGDQWKIEYDFIQNKLNKRVFSLR